MEPLRRTGLHRTLLRGGDIRRPFVEAETDTTILPNSRLPCAGQETGPQRVEAETDTTILPSLRQSGGMDRGSLHLPIRFRAGWKIRYFARRPLVCSKDSQSGQLCGKRQPQADLDRPFKQASVLTSPPLYCQYVHQISASPHSNRHSARCGKRGPLRQRGH